MRIDTGDYVHHGPSGEDWVVAAVEGERLYWCGWPFGGSANLADCTLIKKASDEYRNELIKKLAENSTTERPVILAKLRLQEAQP